MIALYARVSTAEQAKDGYSIGEQQERLKAFCISHGWNDYKMFTDGGYSGGNINRPALQEMIQGIEEGKISKVIVYKLDRLSRSQKDTLHLIEDIFIPRGVDFVSMTESFDTGSAFGKATIGLFSVFGQLERDQIRERVTLGREARAKEGKWHGGSCPPVGYRYQNGELVIDDFEAIQIREIYRLYLNGNTFTTIAETLNNRGCNHRYGKWSIVQIKRVLNNPIYIGVVTFGGMQSEGMHEPIIDKETFERVSAKLQKKTGRRTYKRRQISEAYLANMIYCPRCGAYYTHLRQYKNNRQYSYYCCPNHLHPKVKGIECDNMNHRCDTVDATIFEQMRGLKLSDVKEYREERKKPDIVTTLKKELSNIDKQRSRLIDLYALGTFDVAELDAKIKPLTDAKKALEEQIAQALIEHRTLNEVRETVKSISGIIDHGTPEQKRQLIEALIDYIEIDGEDIKIHWDFN